ncbi:hypothetical protein [Vibrio superstes]|uniref:Outer membrane protein beta-barrel domain-containing protein n=1 Tax=Vibrio superstes NBRC 103154 TaxID=1219062 RepID=A0A511QS17_9VIBR|nr:hypothetical protein [Vibrio superstes]GEM80138.1 hypothetical protein VSU01S_23830 [Vibrio superstes NBRC 103154]
MRRLAILSLFFSANALAESTLVDTIAKFTDIFGISFSQQNGNTVTTLDANYYITEDLRVFGDIDTDINWEVGAGYSVWKGDTYYTENSFKVSEYKISTGIFTAKVLSQNWTAIGDINYNYKFESDYCLSSTCLTYIPSNSIDYSAGVIWSPIQYFDLLYKFNHEIGFSNNTWNGTQNGINISTGKTDLNYHEMILFLNIKQLRPSVTYTYFEEREDTIEFGLTFDF